MTTKLAEQECVPCKGGVPPLDEARQKELLKQIDPEWAIEQAYHLTRTFKFKNFADALAFVNVVGGIAERANHHPDIYLAWGKVKVTVWTHKINGLTESDFIFAAKVDAAE